MNRPDNLSSSSACLEQDGFEGSCRSIAADNYFLVVRKTASWKTETDKYRFAEKRMEKMYEQKQKLKNVRTTLAPN